MWGLPFFLEDPAKRRERKKRRREYLQRQPVEDWDPARTTWKELLGLRAASFKVLDLFPEVERNDEIPRFAKNFITSPCERYRYQVNVLPAYGEISIVNAGRKGSVFFDGPVESPALMRECPVDGWSPWMSLTPMEIMTLRPGTKRAKGHTVVAGLGLGHQLIEVSKRKKVKKLTLVEIDQELVDWLWPRIEPHLAQPVDVVVDDAAKVLPALEADVALIDTFRDYGGNEILYQPKAPVVWLWGKPEMRGNEGYW